MGLQGQKLFARAIIGSCAQHSMPAGNGSGGVVNLANLGASIAAGFARAAKLSGVSATKCMKQPIRPIGQEHDTFGIGHDNAQILIGPSAFDLFQDQSL